MRDGAAYSAAGVRKPPVKETALKERKAVPQALWGFERRGGTGYLESSRCSEACDGEAVDECAGVGVELHGFCDELQRLAGMWTRSGVAGREPASVMSRFAGV
jgi:hypothetical protein